MSSLSNKITHGAAWLVFLRICIRLIGLISTLILVRLLEPGDFGIVAMAMAIVAALELMTAFGFDITLIQDQKAGADDYNTVWTLNVALGIGTAIVLILLAYPAASFFSESRLVPVYMVLALGSLLQGFENIGLVNFRKHLQFEKEFCYQLSIKFTGFIATVALAYVLRSYWALVLGTVFSRFVAVILSYSMQPFRPHISISSIGKIFDFSKWLFVNNILYFVRFRMPDFIVGKILGPSGLGLFTVAFEISNLPTSELIAPINRALLPGFSKISHDIQRARNAFIRTASVLTLISLPAGLGIAATSSFVVHVLLGEKWLATVPLIEGLAIFGAIAAIQSPIGTVLLALGRPRTLSALGAANALVLIPAVVYFTHTYGLAGIAHSFLGTAVLFLPVYYFFAAKALGLTIIDVGRIFVRPGVSVFVMYFAVSAFVEVNSPNLLNLVFSILLGFASYSFTIAATWVLAGRPSAGGEFYMLQLVKSKLRRTITPHD